MREQKLYLADCSGPTAVDTYLNLIPLWQHWRISHDLPVDHEKKSHCIVALSVQETCDYWDKAGRTNKVKLGYRIWHTNCVNKIHASGTYFLEAIKRSLFEQNDVINPLKQTLMYAYTQNGRLSIHYQKQNILIVRTLSFHY